LAPARALALSLALLLLALPPPTATAAPSIPGTVNGYTDASRFEIYGGGLALEGGVNEWTLVCGGCYVRISMTQPSIFVTQDDFSGFLVPGVYEIREFRGLIQHQGDRGAYTVFFNGVGEVNAI
jgi:hypothetical protein